jgi:hypothetical protein
MAGKLFWVALLEVSDTKPQAILAGPTLIIAKDEEHAKQKLTLDKATEIGKKPDGTVAVVVRPF